MRTSRLGHTHHFIHVGPLGHQIGVDFGTGTEPYAGRVALFIQIYAVDTILYIYLQALSH